jgi:hypothetical protein
VVVKLEIAHARVTATREAVSPSHNLITRSSRALYPNRLPLSDDNAHAFVCATLLYAQHMPTSQHHDFWFTTSGTETFLTSGTETFITSGGSTILYTPTPTDSKGPTGLSYTSFTPSSTDSVPSYPSPPPSRVPSTSLSRSSDPVMTSATPSSTPAFNAVEAGPVCLGDGIDASAGGVLAVLLIPTVIGLIIWVSWFLLTAGHH